MALKYLLRHLYIMIGNPFYLCEVIHIDIVASLCVPERYILLLLVMISGDTRSRDNCQLISSPFIILFQQTKSNHNKKTGTIKKAKNETLGFSRKSFIVQFFFKQVIIPRHDAYYARPVRKFDNWAGELPIAGEPVDLDSDLIIF